MNLGIDASTMGSGGGKRHLIEILSCFDLSKHGFSKILIWGNQQILDQIPNSEYVVKFSHKLLNKGLLHRTLWQLFYREGQFKSKIDVLFNPFGTYLGKFRPYATMSRNMLVFDKKEQKRFGFSWYRLKFILLFFIQRTSFRNSQGLIFISQYAKEAIRNYVDYRQIKTAVINHGISKIFIRPPVTQRQINSYSSANPLILLYVSTVFHYKHQINVVEAVVRLKDKGFPIALKLVGGIGQKEVGDVLSKQIKAVDPNNEFITWEQKVGLTEVAEYYHSSDIFIFASSIENMPNILIEAMASGLPIASSSCSPMPEFLENAGLYFNPANTNEIEKVVEKMLNEPELRNRLANTSFANANKYSWEVCADKTFHFLFTLSKKIKF